MDREALLKQLPDALLPWYEQNKRDLPWRKDRDPYHIWLSEIMLQQTRVEAVKGYYNRFLQEIPTVGALAEVDDERLHKLWEGLGYYTRVRNLRKAACRIMEIHKGNFPKDYDSVLALPGVGEYTAGAICSIAYDQKTPAVDGNVLRVISRLTEDTAPIDLPATKRSAKEKLAKIYPQQAGAFTQAIMELGATVCIPNGTPICEKCPCRTFCLANRHDTQTALPVKSSKKPRRQEQMTVFIMRCGKNYALRKRQDRGLLAGLWEFPYISGKPELNAAISQMEQNGVKTKEILRQVEKQHIFTHVHWDMSGVYMEVANMPGDYCWFSAEQIDQEIALPTAFRQFWEEADYV